MQPIDWHSSKFDWVPGTRVPGVRTVFFISVNQLEWNNVCLCHSFVCSRYLSRCRIGSDSCLILHLRSWFEYEIWDFVQQTWSSPVKPSGFPISNHRDENLFVGHFKFCPTIFVVTRYGTFYPLNWLFFEASDSFLFGSNLYLRPITKVYVDIDKNIYNCFRT
jgi:hypothetical protein